MKPLTERLLQVAALVALVYFGYSFSERSVILILQTQNRAAQAEQRATACEKKQETK